MRLARLRIGILPALCIWFLLSPLESGWQSPAVAPVYDRGPLLSMSAPLIERGYSSKHPLITQTPLAVASYSQDSAERLIRYEASHPAMGTVFTLVVYGPDREYLAEVASEVFDGIDQLDGQMSNYQPTSELSRINREAARGPVLVEPQLFRLIQDSVRTSAETGGAFDITVGPLMKTWGFFRGRGRLPAPAEIAAALKHVGYRNLELNTAERTLRFQRGGMEIDLGGIAKGYAVDQAVEILRSRGIRSALVSSGTSSAYALGSPPGERGWQITVRSPYDARKAADIVRLRNFSLSISGDYERFFRIGGKLYCHIMDPRTGRPVENMLATVVLAARCTETDALSTAFFVMGVEGSRRYLATRPNLVGILYQPTGAARAFRRVVLRSPSYNLPPDALVELEAKTTTSSPAPKH